MWEKTLLSSRFLFSLTTISMFLLLISSLFLLHSDDNPLIPSSILDLIDVNKPPLSINAEDNDRLGSPPPFRSITKAVVESGEFEESPLIPHDINDEVGGSVIVETDKMDRRQAVSHEAPHNLDIVNLGALTMCNLDRAALKVYMYDMSPEFHFGLLGWKGRRKQIWPDVGSPGQIPPYPGGLNLQHSVEYWLTLDLLSSNIQHIARPCTAIRVDNANQADVVFVPFFSSLSYNRYSKVQGKKKASLNTMLQDRLVAFLMDQPEWKRSGGKNHIILAHHPNSMLFARKKLGSAMFVLADFGRYPVSIANVGKDIIAPYRHVVRSIDNNSSLPFELRPTLAYFQGAIYRKDGGAIRQELYYLLKDEKDVHFSFGTAIRGGARQASQGMSLSKFCLNIAGDTPSSNRLFDAIMSHCVPVIVSDEIELPFEDILDYSEFSVFIRAADAVKKGFVIDVLKGIGKDEWTKMWKRLKEVAYHFEYNFPSKSGDAVDMIWQAVARKISRTQTNHRRRKYGRPRLAASDNGLTEDWKIID